MATQLDKFVEFRSFVMGEDAESLKQRISNADIVIRRQQQIITESKTRLKELEADKNGEGKKKLKIELDALKNHGKIKSIKFIESNNTIDIRTKKLDIKAPNGQKVYLGTFKLLFWKNAGADAFEVENIDNYKKIPEEPDSDYRVRAEHPHIFSEPCLGDGMQQIEELYNRNFYLYVDAIIQFLETFNPNDSNCMYAGAWFKKDGLPYSDSEQVRIELGERYGRH